MPHGKDGCVELVLHTTPVVTFFPNDTVQIAVGHWPTDTTNQFIHQTAPHVSSANRKNNNTVIQLSNKEKYVLAKNTVLVYSIGSSVGSGEGRPTVLSSPTLFDYKINVKAANAVLANYKDFLNYCKNMVKLRVESDGYVRVSSDEIKDTTFGKILIDNVRNRNNATYENTYEDYAEAFIYFGVGAQRLLLSSTRRRLHPNIPDIANINAQARSMLTNVREAILKFHAKEVLVHTQLPKGKAPTGKYASWILD
jgi:hypothetical protein